jgi:hypothetical protein
MLSDDDKGGDIFDESIGMMDSYKKQLIRRPPMTPTSAGKKKSKLSPPTQSTERMTNNVYEDNINDTKTSIEKAYGVGDEDTELFAKLMDNLGTDYIN